MIVDVHVHVYDEGWIPQAFMRGLGEVVAANVAKSTGEFPDPDILLRGAVKQLKDPEGDLLLADMDEAGVDVSVIFPVDYALGAQEPCSGASECVPIATQNQIFSRISAKHGKRLVHFVGIDPRRKDAAKQVEIGVTEQGARGVKLHPTAGFYPDNPICHPVYRKAQELGVPVLFHTGTQPVPMKAKYARPVFIDSVAADFPDLKIVMAHVGLCWWEEAIALAGTKWNLYVDFSGWQRTFTLHPDKFYGMLRTALDEIGPWRVMFGTDNPYLKLVLPTRQWIDAVKDAPKSHISFSQEEIDIILGQAAAKLLKL
ncbi:MAG: amidohydrolase [Candidatus Abyssobacteria bacterium SURF_5]|uniref:Amidohydrolase n=1 Tax=Abyssobacteria bacterium (strain SURF_5) TaxID=2093360 RepID=A0A3A4N289_ABYX5|nr:MAG: amidohydrolase [Candidatus Abyssubacteria bacterium SURF_5]